MAAHNLYSWSLSFTMKLCVYILLIFHSHDGGTYTLGLCPLPWTYVFMCYLYFILTMAAHKLLIFVLYHEAVYSYVPCISVPQRRHIISWSLFFTREAVCLCVTYIFIYYTQVSFVCLILGYESIIVTNITSGGSRCNHPLSQSTAVCCNMSSEESKAQWRNSRIKSGL